MKNLKFLSKILLLAIFNTLFILFFVTFSIIAQPTTTDSSLSFSSYPLAVSITGRFGQNSDINGEYILVSKSNELILYKKKFSSDELYLFKLKHENKDLWAIGEIPHINEEIRAFIESDSNSKSLTEIEGIWKVFEENPLTLELNIIPDKYVRMKEVSCKNLVKDGKEEGLDCGGDCSAKCEDMKNCVLPQEPPSTYTHGTCFDKQLLKHGEQCEYTCPMGFLTRGAVGRICFNGTLLQVKRGFSCVTGFPNTPCLYMELKGKKDILGECEGSYVNINLSMFSNETDIENTRKSSEKSISWYKENSNSEKMFLYWRDGKWICADFNKKVNKGFILDNKPYRFTIDGNYQALQNVSSVWLTEENNEKSTQITLRCYTPEIASCSALYIQVRSATFENIFEGVWKKIEKASPGGRPQYVNFSGLRIYWIKNGYWIIDVDDNPTEFVAFIFSLEFLPPSGFWRKWDINKKKWSKLYLTIKCSDSIEKLHSFYGNIEDGKGAILLGVGENFEADSVVKVNNVTESKVSGLVQGVLQLFPENFKIKPASPNSYKGNTCFRLKVVGARGKATHCNGVFTRVLSNELHEIIWYKLLIDNTLLYFYLSGGKWICTLNDGAAKGYIEDNKVNLTNKVVGKGFWVSNGGYELNENSSVLCFDQNNSTNSRMSYNKCAILTVNQFTGVAEIFNGLWNLTAFRINGRFHFVKKLLDNNILHLYYNRQSLWVISLYVDRAAIQVFPYLAYIYDATNELPPSGIWTVFDSSKNRATMYSVHTECRSLAPLKDEEDEFDSDDNIL